MATHFVYDDVDTTQIRQGDVLKRTDALEDLLKSFHPHYAENAEYKFFSVLTQSCDLVRRGGKPPKAPYITIAAARTLEDTLLREAAKTQDDWQKEEKVIGSREYNRLLMFVQRLLDNNEPGYFYLHVDQSVGIHRSCCVVLPLSVSVRVQHYDLLLESKIAQIKDSFQAKMGWLLGNMYGRVGTTEWNSEYPDNPVKDEAKKVFDETMHHLPDEQIKEGLFELRESGELNSKTSNEIFQHIKTKNILSKSKRFENYALEVSKTLKLVNLVRGRALNAIREQDLLRQGIQEILRDTELTEENQQELVEQLAAVLDESMGAVMSDDSLPGREEVTQSFIKGLLQNPRIAALLR